MIKHISLVSRAHTIIREKLHPGAIAVDATVGNGCDTLFLLQQIAPSGRVYGFDIQRSALDSVRSKIGETALSGCLTLIHGNHALMAENIPQQRHGQISVCMFNLGYLPGGDKTIITRTESTLAALTAASELLSVSGIITVIAYPGHPGGDRETERVEQWCEDLDSEQFKVDTIFSKENNATVPRLFVICKTGQRT